MLQSGNIFMTGTSTVQRHWFYLQGENGTLYIMKEGIMLSFIRPVCNIYIYEGIYLSDMCVCVYTHIHRYFAE